MRRVTTNSDWWGLITNSESSLVVNEDSSEINQLSNLTVNLSGKVRRESLDGRSYLVAPLSMIVPGVLNGSKGPLYYPLNEISRGADGWNRMPIVVNHPTDDKGLPCSARSPRIIEKFGIGDVYNASVSGTGLRAEGWFDEEKTRKLSPETLNKLLNGEAGELSTGLFTDNEPVKNREEAVFNGKSYTHIARNHRADHLAVLTKGRGACSVDDGCGVNVTNQSEEDRPVSNEGCAGCGKSCSCKDCKEKHGKPVKELEKNEQESPLASNSGSQNVATRNLMVQELIANCSCWEKEDEAALNAMPESKLKSIYDNHKETQRLQSIVDNMGDEEEDEEEESMPAPKAKGKKPPFVKNSDSESRLTPEERRDIQWARAERERVTNELIETITANENCAFTEEYLQTRTMDELKGLAKLASAPTANEEEEEEKPARRVRVLNFAGVSPGGATRNQLREFSNDDQDMVPAGIDWSKAE